MRSSMAAVKHARPCIMTRRGNVIMEQPSKFQHQLQPDMPSSSMMSPSPHPEQTPPWGALWVLALGLAKAVSSSAGGVIGSFRSGDGPAAQFGDEAPKIADAMTSGFIEGNRWTLWWQAACCSSVCWLRSLCDARHRRIAHTDKHEAGTIC